jgi:hypothetical protein
LKTRTPINTSRSFFGKHPGFNVGFGFCSNSRELRKNEKKYKNFGGLISYSAFNKDTH